VAKLEQEITVVDMFHSEQERALVNFVYSYNVFYEQTQQVLKPYKLNDQHYNVLKILESFYPHEATVGEIREHLLNKRSDLTRLIDKLVDMELVDRAVNPENRRSVDVALSEAGKRHLATIDADLEAHRPFGQKLTEDDAVLLNQLLNKMRS